MKTGCNFIESTICESTNVKSKIETPGKGNSYSPLQNKRICFQIFLFKNLCRKIMET